MNTSEPTNLRPELEIPVTLTGGEPQPKRRRKRKGSPPKPKPLCPVHQIPMLVGRTLQSLQYRYCPHPDCRESKRTFRSSPMRENRSELNPGESVH
jgi:hypothetical protein